MSGSDCDSQVCVAGICQPGSCGDGFINTPTETCDDGNDDSFDGCSSGCVLPVDQLLISELVTSPTSAEMIEIYNPGPNPVNLDQVYLSDAETYYQVTTNSASVSSADFLLQFPPGSTIPSKGFVVVSLDSAAAFKQHFAAFPSFDLDAQDNGSPAMLGKFGTSSGLTNGAEFVVLFSWDGQSDLVSDIDYVRYGQSGSAIDKTGVTVGQSTYKNDTPFVNQLTAKAPGSGQALHRCDTAETTETTTGGNGLLGHDETSENGQIAWKIAATPSPLAPPASSICP